MMESETLSHCLACQSQHFGHYIHTHAMMSAPSAVQYNFDRCNDCGLVFLNPRVAESELSHFYTESYLPYRIEEAWGRYASFVKKEVKLPPEFVPLSMVSDGMKLTHHYKQAIAFSILESE